MSVFAAQDSVHDLHPRWWLQQQQPALSLPFGMAPRNGSFTFECPSRLSTSSNCSRSTSPSKRRSVRWGKSLFSREASQGDDVLEEKAFPLSHTRTLPLDSHDMDCEHESDCEIGYHSDTAIDIRFSPVMALKRRLETRVNVNIDYDDEQTTSDFDEEDDDDSGDALFSNVSSDQADTPAMSPSPEQPPTTSSSDNDDEEVHTPIDVEMPSIRVARHEEIDDDDDGMVSEYEAPVLRKRKRKADFALKGRVKRHEPLDADEVSSSGASERLEAPSLPVVARKPLGRRNPGKRMRLEHPFVVPGVLEFPCPYVSPEGHVCGKTFPRWTDYEKHYETLHTGDSGYPWVQKIEAKDCPFRCPHPIPTASKPKPKQGRLVKTVEYGCCDFVTRKNTHDFERHWKGNHIRSEALFIARGNMQMEEAKYVNIKEKFDIAYALCPKCPRCHENFTRTDALTRHLRSPCAGGSVGAAMDDNHYSTADGTRSH